jgi:hypothetical protein
VARLARSALAPPLAGVLALAAVACDPARPPRDAGPRSDAGPRGDTGDGDLDAGGGGLDAWLDAWLDPTLDADLDAFEPSALDAWRPDADQDVGPVDAYLPPTADAGAGVVDAGVAIRRDAGPFDGGTDARLPSGTCGILWERGDPVPSDCMPRCSRASRDLFEGCFGDTTCEATVMARDTSRPAQLFVWPERDFTDLDCAACIGTQRFSCWHDRCPSQSEAWVDCLARRSSEACTREQQILERCLAPYEASVAACLTARVAACFPR